MSILTVIFSHGRESGPWGVKIRALAKVAEQLGCRVISRDDRDTQDPDLRVERLIAEGKGVDGPLILVGSSMGGYVATVASTELNPLGLFLMAPAIGLPGYAVGSPVAPSVTISIVHGWEDEVVPGEAVLAFAQKHQAMLHLVPASHALQEQLDWLCEEFRLFLEQRLEPVLQAGRQARMMATF